MKLLVAIAAFGTLFAAGCTSSETVVDREAAKMKQTQGPTEKCAVCARDFPEGSLKDRNGQRMCGGCIDSQG
jgi:hypothetical protein